jgi:hypothetical protein
MTKDSVEKAKADTRKSNVGYRNKNRYNMAHAKADDEIM